MIHNNTYQFSKLELYYISRFAKIGGLIYNDLLSTNDKIDYLQSIIDDNYDSGNYNKYLVESLSYYGVCEESLYPYDVALFNNHPSQECLSNGLNNKIKDYHSITNPYNNRQLIIDEIKYFINNDIPVVFGLNTYDSLWESNQNNFLGNLTLPQNKKKNDGQHAMILVGYDDINRRFWFQNSHGTDYGINLYSEKREESNNGFGYLPYDYLFAYKLDDTTIDNIYMVDGFIVVLSQYIGNKLNHINPNIEIKYNNDIVNNLHIKFESTKPFIDNLIKLYNIKPNTETGAEFETDPDTEEILLKVSKDKTSKKSSK